MNEKKRETFAFFLDENLKESRRENDRQKQIAVQLEILERLDQKSTRIVSLRQQLIEEKHRQILLPTVSSRINVLPEKFESIEEEEEKQRRSSTPLKRTTDVETFEKATEAEQTSLDEVFEEILSIESKETDEISLTGKSPLKVESNVTIETDFTTKITRLPGQVVEESNSIETSFSSIRSELKLVGNPKKTTIVEAKGNQRQLATINDRVTSVSRRDFGEVFIRHRVKFEFSMKNKTNFCFSPKTRQIYRRIVTTLQRKFNENNASSKSIE